VTDLFDKTKDFKEIEKSIKAIQGELHMAGIPFMFAAALKDDGEHTEWFSTGLTPGSLNMELSDDRVRRALNILHGLDEIACTPPRSNDSYERHVAIAEEEDEDAFIEEIILDMQKGL